MEQVDYDGLVPEDVVLPGLGRHHDIRPPIAVSQFRVRLQKNYIKPRKTEQPKSCGFGRICINIAGSESA